MDEIIKLIMELMQKRPQPKGGIADVPVNVQFMGQPLTKTQLGDLTLVGSRVTDASRFKPFLIQNVGRDKRYSYIIDYETDLTNSFNKTIKFLKENPNIRLTQVQKDNLYYNLGVLKRVSAEKKKLEKGIIDEGKKPEEIYNKDYVDNKPLEDLSLEEAFERFFRTTEDAKKKMDEIKKEKESIVLSYDEISQERKDHLARLYYGKGYKEGSATWRGLGSYNLPKLHEEGIIKMDETLYQNLKQGKHQWGGGKYFAPDPVRIWRYHFGDNVFEKMKNWDYNNNESVFDWLKRNNIQPIKREGPTEALDYMHPVEIKAELADEIDVFNKYKNPNDEASRGYYGVDNPEMRMERIVYHGENIAALEKALQRLSVDDYKQYLKDKPKVVTEGKILPFKDLNAEGGIVGLHI